jgi:aspartyl-tRNA(Asn)/glutamyl-tRNA(Gln) amidotransferase subunit B
MFEPVVGLEVHLALRTATKLFCSCPLDAGSEEPNASVCPVCLGLPGTLPVVNDRAIELAVTLALALGAEVAPAVRFDRKHYFYPDSPKNYQISQHAMPIGRGGAVRLPSGKVVRVRHCHLEEDAGRLAHPPYASYSLVDLGRAGTPLIELVTEPDIASPEEARAFLEEVQAIARATGVSDASPEEGKMRADVNVSLRREDGELGTKVEVKNLNSFRNVAAAVTFEVKRQQRLVEAGRAVQQETRGFNEGGQRTYTMRVKEGSEDYRYLADPDLPSIGVTGRVGELAAALPELPAARAARYEALGLRAEDARLLAYDTAAARVFDAAVAVAPAQVRALAAWLTVDVAGALAAAGRPLDPETFPVRGLARLVTLVEGGQVSGPTAKGLLPEVMGGADPDALVAERGLAQLSDEGELVGVVDRVVSGNPDLVARAKVNPKAVNALLGEVMKATRGTAKPDLARRLIEERLAKA